MTPSTENHSVPTSKVEILELIRSNVIGNKASIRTPYGKKKIVYADYTASGRGLHFIEDYIQNIALPMYANTHTEASATGAETTHLIQIARETVRSSINAPKEDYAVLFTGTGATGAINKLFHVLGLGVSEFIEKKWEIRKHIPIKERPVVFISHLEHHSNELIWRESIARVVVIREGKDGTPDLLHLERELKQYQKYNVPLIGSFSAGSNVTGIRTPVKLITSILHKYGAYSFFDYAGVGAYVSLNVKKTNVDAVFLSPHKFIGGPGTSGLLVARKFLFRQAFDVKTTKPTVPGGGTVKFVTKDDTLYTTDIEAREDAGTPGILQSIRTGLVFKVKETIGSKTIKAIEKNHSAEVLNAWSSHRNIVLLGGDRSKYRDPAHRVTIFSFNINSPFPPSHPTLAINRVGPLLLSKENTTLRQAIVSESSFHGNQHSQPSSASSLQRQVLPLHHNFIVALLNDVYGIQARGGCACAGPYALSLLGLSTPETKPVVDHMQELVHAGFGAFKVGWARVNFNYFIVEAEMKFIIEAVKQIAVHGWKLLPYYIQDLKSGQFIHRDIHNEERRTSHKQPLTFLGENLYDDFQGIKRKTSKDSHGSSSSRSKKSFNKVLKKAMKLYKQNHVINACNLKDFTQPFPVGLNLDDVWWLRPREAANKLSLQNLQPQKKKMVNHGRVRDVSGFAPSA
jgi:selenocysteine lyase/cysteine desulfurase